MKTLLMIGLALPLAVLGVTCGQSSEGDDASTDNGTTTDAGSDTEADLLVDITEDVTTDIAEDVTTDEDASIDTGADAADIVSDPATDADADAGADGGTIDGLPVSPLFGRVIFNEVLIDGTAEGDPNGDGDTGHPFEDQFVELVNVHDAAVDLSGWLLIEEDFTEANARHTFPEGFSLPAGQAVVVFGGGDAPEALSTAVFLTANAQDPPGLSFGLHLSTPADDVFLLDPEGGAVARFCYGASSGECALPAASDTSLTRSPDLTGDFTDHVGAPDSGGVAFSPGTRLDGSPF